MADLPLEDVDAWADTACLQFGLLRKRHMSVSRWRSRFEWPLPFQTNSFGYPVPLAVERRQSSTGDPYRHACPRLFPLHPRPRRQSEPHWLHRRRLSRETSGVPPVAVLALPYVPLPVTRPASFSLRLCIDGSARTVFLSLLHTFPFVVQGTREIRPNTDGRNPNHLSQLEWSWHVKHSVVSTIFLPPRVPSTQSSHGYITVAVLLVGDCRTCSFGLAVFRILGADPARRLRVLQVAPPRLGHPLQRVLLHPLQCGQSSYRLLHSWRNIA